MIKRIMRLDRSLIVQINPTPVPDLSATPPPGTCQTAIPTQARRYLAWTEHRNSGRILATRLTSNCDMMLQLLTNAQPHWRRPRREATLTLSPAIFFLSILQPISRVRLDSPMRATDHTAISLQSEKSKPPGVQNRMIARELDRRSWHTHTVAHGGTHLA